MSIAWPLTALYSNALIPNPQPMNAIFEAITSARPAEKDIVHQSVNRHAQFNDKNRAIAAATGISSVASPM